MNIYIENYDSSGMMPREERRYQHTAGRRLLKTALFRMGISLDLDFISEEENLIFEHGPSGKPFLRDLPDVHFNISHTKGLVVCAVGTASVGIDAEQIRSYPKSVLRKMTEKERLYIAQAKSPDEAFMRVWTMKEAMIKLTGEGLSAFSKTECVPGESLYVWNERAVCNEIAEGAGMPHLRCRQMIWQGRYVITAIESTNKNQDCIF